MFRPPLYGFLLGILTDALIWFSGPFQAEDWWTKFVIWLSTPAAHVVSWFTGWPMEQEAAIFHYAIGMLITFPVLGLLIGFIYSGMKVLINRKNEN